MLRTIQLVILLLLITLSLTACTNENNSIFTTVSSVSYLNPNRSGVAEPVVVNILQLKTINTIHDKTYYQIVNQFSDEVNSNLIDKNQFEIQPGKNKKIQIKLNTDTHYIAVVVGYRNIQKIQWLKIIKVKDRTREINLFINLKAHDFDIKEN